MVVSARSVNHENEDFCKQRIQVEHCTSACRDDVTVAMALSGPRAQRMMVMQMNSKEPCAPGRDDSEPPNPEATQAAPMPPPREQNPRVTAPLSSEPAR